MEVPRTVLRGADGAVAGALCYWKDTMPEELIRAFGFEEGGGAGESGFGEAASEKAR